MRVYAGVVSSTFNFCLNFLFNPKTAEEGGVNLTPPCSFFKNVSSKERVKAWIFVAFNIIMSHIFPKNVTEIPHVVQKIRKISLSISATFINVLDFLTFPCYKLANDLMINDVSIFPLSTYFGFKETQETGCIYQKSL